MGQQLEPSRGEFAVAVEASFERFESAANIVNEMRNSLSAQGPPAVRKGECCMMGTELEHMLMARGSRKRCSGIVHCWLSSS